MGLFLRMGYNYECFRDSCEGESNEWLYLILKYLADGSLSDTAVSFSNEVLERERRKQQLGGGNGGMNNTLGGNPNDIGGPGGQGGMGKKSSSTSQLSAAGNAELLSVLVLSRLTLMIKDELRYEMYNRDSRQFQSNLVPKSLHLFKTLWIQSIIIFFISFITDTSF